MGMSLSCPAGKRYGAVDVTNSRRHHHGATWLMIRGHTKKVKVWHFKNKYVEYSDKLNLMTTMIYTSKFATF